MAGSVLDLTGCSYTAGATIDKALTVRGASIRVPAGAIGIRVTAGDVTLEQLRIVGAQAGAFDENEKGVSVVADQDAPVRGLTIRDCEIADFGGEAVDLRFVAGVVLERNDIHDIVYAGVLIVSGSGGTIEDNVIRRIGVRGADANANNAYGIALTDGGLAADPPSTDFVVRGNTVEDVPTWHALDTHGGQRISFSRNTVRRSSRGLFITRSANGNRATDVTVTDNTFASPDPVEFNLQAVTIYAGRNVTITGNAMNGWPSGATLQDYRHLSTGLRVSDNTCDGLPC